MPIGSSLKAYLMTVAARRNGQGKQRLLNNRVTPTDTGFLRFASAVVILLLVAVHGRAQTTSGTILGTLTDQSGAVIPNTPVTLINTGSSDTRQTTTNQSGYYQFVNVPPGTYRITVSKEGFKTTSREPIDLQVEGSVQIDLTMEVGSQSQNVNVTAATPLIQAETTTLGTVVDQRQTNEIPLNGRNALNLASLVPSVVPLAGAMANQTGSNPFEWGNYQIGGGFSNESITFIDGSPVNTGYLNLTGLIPTQDSLQEFKVDTNNLPAEFGHFAGGAINFRTKSGSNELHGGAWEYLRNKVLNANTFFGNQGGLSVPPFTQNQYGFNVGGPVYIPHVYDGRNKTFFFVNWEGFALRQGQTFTETVPTAAEIGGDLSALQTAIYDPTTTCGASPGVACAPGQAQYNRQQFPNAQIPANRINPTSLLYLKTFFPAPNTAGGPLGINNFVANASVGGNNRQTVVHIDHNFSTKQHLSARYTYWTNDNLPINPLGTGICADRCTELFNVNDFVLADTYTINPTTILDVNISYMRFVYSRLALLDKFSLTTIGMPAALASQVQYPGPPVMSVSGFDTAGTFSSQGADSTIIEATDNDRISGNLTKFLGNHTLKFGGEFMRGTFNYAQANTSAGIFTFTNGFTAQNPLTSVGGAGLASFLLGYPGSGNITALIPTAGEQLYPGLYANDDWRVSSRLTMHMGLRWEDNFPWTERHDRMSWFDPTAVNPLLQGAGITQYPGSVELVASSTRSSRSNTNNFLGQFAPRLGLDYRATSNTVFSLGYGLFWIPTDIAWLLPPNNNPINTFQTPFAASIDNGLTPANNISNPFPGGIVPAPGRSSSFQGDLLGTSVNVAFPKNNPYPYTQQWNVGVQQQFGSSFALNIAYGGAKGTHLPYGSILTDQLPDQDLALGEALNTPIPNPFAGVISSNYSLGASTIPAGQLLLKYPQYGGVGVAGAFFADSTFNSLQIKAQKRFPRGASINAAYTWAKIMSDTDTQTPWFQPSASSIQDYNNLKAEKALSSADVRNVGVISYIYDLPVGRGQQYLPNVPRAVDYVIGGWGVGGVTTFMSGFPLGFGTNQNLTNSFGGGSRPNYTPGCSKQTHGSAPSRLNGWFNTSCFTQPDAFTFGNEPRNDANLTAPGIANWDASLFKKFPLTADGRVNLQFRAEAFNLFNRVQFGYPGLTEGTANFGVIGSQINNPRVLQFSLRASF